MKPIAGMLAVLAVNKARAEYLATILRRLGMSSVEMFTPAEAGLRLEQFGEWCRERNPGLIVADSDIGCSLPTFALIDQIYPTPQPVHESVYIGTYEDSRGQQHVRLRPEVLPPTDESVAAYADSPPVFIIFPRGCRLGYWGDQYRRCFFPDGRILSDLIAERLKTVFA